MTSEYPRSDMVSLRLKVKDQGHRVNKCIFHTNDYFTPMLIHIWLTTAKRITKRLKPASFKRLAICDTAQCERHIHTYRQRDRQRQTVRISVACNMYAILRAVENLFRFCAIFLMALSRIWSIVCQCRIQEVQQLSQKTAQHSVSSENFVAFVLIA